jgi:hypothetical protein
MQERTALDIFNELLQYNEIEVNNKCITFRLSNEIHKPLDIIARKHGYSFSKMINNVLLSLISQIIHNNYVFSPDLSDFNIREQRIATEGKKGKHVTIHVTESVFKEINKICNLNDRTKSILVIYAALSCLKQKKETIGISYDLSPFNLDFKI